jgi:hypothetical protein
MAGTAAQSADVDDLFSLSLRPGGTTSLFAAFGKGAGVGIKPRNQVRPTFLQLYHRIYT